MAQPISMDSKITITLVGTIIGAVVWVISTVNTVSTENRERFNVLEVKNTELKADIKVLSSDIEALQNLVITKTADRYTKAEQEAHFLRMAILNPGMKIPDPKNPGMIIVVNSARIGENDD